MTVTSFGKDPTNAGILGNALKFTDVSQVALMTGTDSYSLETCGGSLT
jgi:hypothetical protein